MGRRSPGHRLISHRLTGHRLTGHRLLGHRSFISECSLHSKIFLLFLTCFKLFSLSLTFSPIFTLRERFFEGCGDCRLFGGGQPQWEDGGLLGESGSRSAAAALRVPSPPGPRAMPTGAELPLLVLTCTVLSKRSVNTVGKIDNTLLESRATSRGKASSSHGGADAQGRVCFICFRTGGGPAPAPAQDQRPSLLTLGCLC